MGITVFDYVAFERLCAYKGITKSQVANALGISRVTLWRKSIGISDFTRGELDIIADLLAEDYHELAPIFFAEKVS